MSVFTPLQRAELRDAAARSLIEYRLERAAAARLRAEARRAERVTTTRPREPKIAAPLPPRSERPPAATPTAASLAAKLLPHVCAESVIDRERHALCVAQTILKLGRA